jgi:hypothetical protein
VIEEDYVVLMSIAMVLGGMQTDKKSTDENGQETV